MLDEFFQRRRILDADDTAVDPGAGESLADKIGEQVAMLPLGIPHQRREDEHPLVGLRGDDPLDDLVAGLGLEHAVALRAVCRADPREEHPQEVVNLRHRRHGRPRIGTGRFLRDRDRRRESRHAVDVGPGQLSEKLPGERRQAFDVAPLPLGIERVESEARLAGAAHARQADEPPTRQADRHIAEVVLPCTTNDDRRDLHAGIVALYSLVGLAYDRVFRGRSRQGRGHPFGAVAQLGERGVRNAEVGSSILLRSTFSRLRSQPWPLQAQLALRCAGRGGFQIAGWSPGPMTVASELAAVDPSAVIMLRVHDGDAEAFEQLVALWQDRLVTLFRHHTGDHSTAEDLAQEVFLRVYRARAGYKPTAKFSTWIHTIANNVASDLRQRAYRRREHGMPMNVSASSSAIGLEQIAVAASGQRPARQADRGELQDVVQEAIRGLSDNQRMAVLLAKFEQCSYDEIAAAMGLTVPAVKSLLFRAREQLREMLGPYEREGHR